MNRGLRVDGLTERYGNKLAVDGLSFGVAPGEILALAGPNGAGKTTTLLCVAGLLRPEAGLFFWQDRPLGPERTRTMAPIPETPDVYDMLTVWEHLVFVANSCRLSNGWEEHAEALLKRLAIADQRDNLGEALSKRMRQKLLVAAAILASTPVGFVLIGLALIASAFSNLPVQVSGLVNIRLSHPPARPWFRSCSEPSALLCCCSAWQGCSILRVTLRQPGPDGSEGANPHHAPEPGVKIGVPLPPNRPSEVGSES